MQGSLATTSRETLWCPVLYTFEVPCTIHKKPLYLLETKNCKKIHVLYK